jgi:hypothetical protein
MTVHAVSLPALVFIGLVLACFATFIITLAGEQIYTLLPARRAKVRAAAPRDSSPAGGNHAVSA